jgi:hypothetical protein
MSLRLLAVVLFGGVASGSVFADALRLVDGRFDEGSVSVFTLTSAQRAFIECVRANHTDNTKTPYVFRLTSAQAAQLKREAGLGPSRFQVYETYLGFNDAGPHWNLALRFDEAHIEVPHKLLLSDRDAERAEFKVQGWAPNPSVERKCHSNPVASGPNPAFNTDARGRGFAPPSRAG